MACYVPQQKIAANSLSPITLLQIVPSLAGSGLARATLDTAQAVIAAGGRAIVASPGGAMLPDLLRLRATHIDLPEWGSPLWSRLSLPARLASSLRPSDVRERSPDAADRLYTIPPGINLDRFDPAQVRADRVVQLAGDLRVPDGSHVVLCPARFDRDRGQKLLVEAIRRLGRENVFCLLLGSTGAPTAFEKEVEQAIEAAKLHGRVQIGPYVEDMPAAYMLRSEER